MQEKGLIRKDYVPFTMWTEAEPIKSAVVQTSLSSFKHELFVDNFAGIPILQQHGSADDNVPAYHSRLMSQLLAHSDLPSAYVELPGKGHWFDGIMTTEPLRRFYSDKLGRFSKDEGDDNEYDRSRLPSKDFSITIPNSADMGSRCGIEVEQLESPDVLGKIEVKTDGSTAITHLHTSNIHRFQIHSGGFSRLVVDGDLDMSLDAANISSHISFVKLSGQWQVSSLTPSLPRGGTHG